MEELERLRTQNAIAESRGHRFTGDVMVTVIIIPHQMDVSHQINWSVQSDVR